jgi:hypothetical protein
MKGSVVPGFYSRHTPLSGMGRLVSWGDVSGGMRIGGSTQGFMNDLCENTPFLWVWDDANHIDSIAVLLEYPSEGNSRFAHTGSWIWETFLKFEAITKNNNHC